MQTTHSIPQTMERPNMAEKWYEATQRFKSEVMSDRAKTRIKKEFAHAADLSASKVKHLLDGATRPTTDEVNTFAGLVEKEWLTAKDFAEFAKPAPSTSSPRRRKPSLRTSKQPLHD